MRPRPPDREPFFSAVTMTWENVDSPDRFPYTVPAIQKLQRLALHPAVTFIIGENGAGKSTLLEAIAVRLNMRATGGAAREDFSRRPVDGGLHDAIQITKNPRRSPADRFFIRAETVFDLASELDEDAKEDARVYGSYGGKSLHTRSHGEAFLAIVQSRLGEESFYILDEPEAALSPARQLTVLKEIDWLVRGGSQFVIATHSPILMSYPDSWIYELEDDGFKRVEYQDTQHYTLTKSFLDHPDAFLRHLIE